MIPDHLKAQRQLSEQLSQAARSLSDKIAQAGLDHSRAAAAFEGKIEEIESDEAAELKRHTDALIALQSRRDNAWADYQTVIHDAQRRLRATAIELAGGGEVRSFPQAAE
jgi:hypothetical protein